METIANCFDLNEALQLKMALEAAGITSFIPDENTAGIAPFQFLTKSGVRLQVEDDQAEEARQIVADNKQQNL